MLCRLALLTLLGGLAACEPPPQVKQPMSPKAREKALPAPLSKQQAGELSGQCEKMSREQFRRAWKDGTEQTAEGRTTAVSRPKACRVESFYCASGGEWDVLVRPYMED